MWILIKEQITNIKAEEVDNSHVKATLK